MDSYFLLPFKELILSFVILYASFIIFGIAGFGTVLISGPLLALFLPVSEIIPLIAILDFIAAFLGSLWESQYIEKSELKKLIPLMILGSLLGATLLLKSHNRFLLIALGIFAVCYALYSLSGLKWISHFKAYLVIPFGFVGGIFSAIFGSGGFIYSIYLNNRIEDKNRVRATQKVLLIFSTLTRILIFLIAGVYLSLSFLLTTLLFAPAMFLGIYTGRHLNLKISRAQFSKIVSLLILLSGTTLIIKYFTS